MSPHRNRTPARQAQYRSSARLWAWVYGLILLAAAPSSFAGDRTFTATVTAVPSGDTLVVRTAQGDRPIRLLGVDTPAADQAFGGIARTRTAELALGNGVTVYPVREDPRGRIVAAVRLPDGRDLGHVLVVGGLARWDRHGAPGARGLEDAEAEARAAGRGLWRTSAGTTSPRR